jgi:hypothetical protein
MPQHIQAPDGSVIEFPDGMDDRAISAVMQKQFPPQKQAPPAEASPMSWGDVAGKAIINTPSSALHLGENIYQAVRHPIDTLGTVADIARGGGQELGHYLRGDGDNYEKQPQQQAFDAAKGYFGDRYGSMEGFKNSLANDPVGMAADASILAGGAGMAAKAGGLTKAAALADKLGEVSNPISLIGKGIGGTANLTGKALAEILGTTTGAGGQSVRRAFGSGLEGGTASQAFTNYMRGKAPIEGIVTDAKTALGNMRSDRGAEYRAGMGSVNSNPAILDLAPVDAAIGKTSSVNNFKGIDLDPKTAGIRKEISDSVELWRNQNPGDFHTAEGFDALKKRIGKIRDSTAYGTGDRMVADAAYNAIKGEIVSQAPEYGAVMDKYAAASKQLDDVSGTMSLGPNANIDTSVRKLQSAMRNDVNTNYGRRADIAQILSDNGAPNLMDKIAGQQLSAPTTRGIGKLLTQGELAGVIPALVTGGPTAAAALIPPLLASSPRLVGELAHATGKTGRLGKLLSSKLVPKSKSALIADELGQQQNNNSAAKLGAMLMQGNR